MPIRAAATASLCVFLLTATGCAGGLGNKRYACDGMPSRPLCLSAADVYALTEGDGPPPAERPAATEKDR
jgi:hypothetical protein